MKARHRTGMEAAAAAAAAGAAAAGRARGTAWPTTRLPSDTRPAARPPGHRK